MKNAANRYKLKPYGTVLEIEPFDNAAHGVNKAMLDLLMTVSADGRVFIDAWWAEQAAFEPVRTSDWLVYAKNEHRYICEANLAKLEALNPQCFDSRFTYLCVYAASPEEYMCYGWAHPETLLKRGKISAYVSGDETGGFCVGAVSEFTAFMNRVRSAL